MCCLPCLVSVLVSPLSLVCDLFDSRHTQALPLRLLLVPYVQQRCVRIVCVGVPGFLVEISTPIVGTIGLTCLRKNAMKRLFFVAHLFSAINSRFSSPSPRYVISPARVVPRLVVLFPHVCCFSIACFLFLSLRHISAPSTNRPIVLTVC